MLSLTVDRMFGEVVPVSTGWLLGACMEARGRQDLYVRQKPEVLAALREQAMVQSVESSNRIEGVTVEPARLRPILLGRSRPRDRSEEELIGYRKALNWIFTHKRPIPVEPKTILHLHEMAQGGASSDAGKWKQRDNEIVEILPNNERRIRFVPERAKTTPQTVARLCDCYKTLCERDGVPVLLTIATFVFDLLCVHPFRDGNGRVSRLMTSLLLEQHGFAVGRFVSLERIVEETYYRILEQCSVGWHEGKNELAPWWNFFLSMLNAAYRDFERKVEESQGIGKGALVRQLIERQVGEFTLAELRAQCPSVSPQMIKKILSQMKEEGKAICVGHGRGATWSLKR